jgi:prepilin peptidase CpaA
MSAPSSQVEMFTLLAILVLAAVSDWRSRRIPNGLILFGLAVAIVSAASGGGTDRLVTALAGAGTGFLLLLPGFMLRFTGAGDVKLLAMLGAFLGPPVVLQVFVLTILLGASLVLLKSLFRRHGVPLIAHLRRYAAMFSLFVIGRQFVYLPPPAGSTLSERVPMAPIMAVAVLVTLSLGPMALGG